MTEEWRTIPGHPKYEVSSLGRVRSWNNGNAPGLRSEPRILKLQDNRRSHISVMLDGQRLKAVHQLVALAFIGPRPEGQVTRHLDDDRTNNRLDNIAYGTYSENALDAVRNGRNPRAARTHCSNGHEYNEQNTRHGFQPNGRPRRWCKACTSEFHAAKKVAS